MAIDYTSLFTRLGRFVSEANLWTTRQGTLLLNAGVGADSILDQFNDARDLVDGVLPLYQSAAGSMRSWINTLNKEAMTFVSSLQGELNAPSTNPSVLLPILRERMVLDSQTIKANTVSAPASSPVAGIIGSGAVVMSRLTPYGSNDETAISEVLRVRCTQDAWNGSSSGSEVFSIVGQPKQSPEEGYLPRGSGVGPNVRPTSASNLVSGGNFNSFSSNVPTGWTVTAGAAGTTILQSTTVLDAYSSSLEYKSNGATATIRLKGVISGSVRTSTVYAVTVRVRRSGGSWTSGASVKVSVRGTGLSDQDVVSVDPSALTASFASYTLFFVTPGSIPDDYRIDVEWTTATGNSGKSVYFSGLNLVEPVVHNGTQFIITRGVTDFTVGDEFVITTSNDYAGKFQTWFGRFYGIQLPSSGSPTISDSLAS